MRPEGEAVEGKREREPHARPQRSEPGTGLDFSPAGRGKPLNLCRKEKGSPRETGLGR